MANTYTNHYLANNSPEGYTTELKGHQTELFSPVLIYTDENGAEFKAVTEDVNFKLKNGIVQLVIKEYYKQGQQWKASEGVVQKIANRANYAEQLTGLTAAESVATTTDEEGNTTLNVGYALDADNIIAMVKGGQDLYPLIFLMMSRYYGVTLPA